MLEPRQIGRSGLRVSPVCLGTANFGHVTDAPTAHRMLSRALAEGVFFLDTADIYNREELENPSEVIIGRWFGEDRARRQRVVLATKVYGVTGEGANDRGLSARHIRLACEESLRRLRTDWIDLYILHHVDRTVHWEETLDALERLKTEGKILYYGTSNFAAWQLTGLHLTACVRNMFGPISEQSPYSLARREVESEVLPACRHQGIGFLAYSPLAEGLLAGPDAGTRRTRPTTAKRRAQNAKRLDVWHECCRNHGLAPSAAALGWVMSQPDVTAAVIGPRTEEQLDDAIAAASVPPDAALLEAIAAEWPGPGVAPEAYAW